MQIHSVPLRVLIATTVVFAVPLLFQGQAHGMPSPEDQEVKIYGTIITKSADSMTVRDGWGTEHTVKLTGETKFKERKKNFFRGSKVYQESDLARGLRVEVHAHRRSEGSLYADQIKFTDDDFKMANSIENRVEPLEGRLDDTEGRLTEAEVNAQRLSGQVDELSAISNAARGGAKAAQESADSALEGVAAANTRIDGVNTRIDGVNTRVSALDNFEVKSTTTIPFKFGSTTLSEEAQNLLDALAREAENEKGYAIEITGHASADGPEDVNRRLSKQRAEAVLRYLAEDQGVPLRRIITPHGFGEKQPFADNKSRDGRKLNRRVEVRILVSKGLSGQTEHSSLTGQ